MHTLTLKDGYSRNKNPEERTFRPMTPQEARTALGEIYFTGDHKTFRRCRVNGAAKTWKTRPDVELPVKYGMYEAVRAHSSGDEMRLPNGGILLVAASPEDIAEDHEHHDDARMHRSCVLCQDILREFPDDEDKRSDA